MTDRPTPTGGRMAVGPQGTFPEDVFPRPFGNYLLLKVFARGGMGEVYLARQISSGGLDRYCVVKKLRKELTRDREYVTRFIDEARVVVHLDHPNICRTFDVGRVGEEYYLAMEYVSGCDVRMVQDKARTDSVPMNADAVLPLMSELLEALDHAHHRRDRKGELLRLVHRDISPQNVMISYDGEVKLIDFGLASSKLKIEKTQPNVVMGKMAYMSPEQARGDAIDHRADLFAVGVMTYELLANERFYEGMGTHEIWQVVGRGGFAPKRWRELDPTLQAIIGKALHPDHNKRFETCGAFRDALNAYLSEHYPQAGRGTVRAVIEEMFYEEISAERSVLAGFANTNLTDLSDDIERSRSQSVSLVEPADLSAPMALHGAGDDADGARVAHQDSAQTHDEKTPPTGTHPDHFHVGLHEANTFDGSEGLSLDSLPARKPANLHEERTALHEATEMISRADGPPAHIESTMVVRTDPTLMPHAAGANAPDNKKLKVIGIAAGIAILLLVGVIGFILLRSPETQTNLPQDAKAPATTSTVAAEGKGGGEVRRSPRRNRATAVTAPKSGQDRASRKRRTRSRSRSERKTAKAKTSPPASTKATKATPKSAPPPTTRAKEPPPPVAEAPPEPKPPAPPATPTPQPRSGLSAEEIAKNASNRAQGTVILKNKGYQFRSMYPLSLRIASEAKKNESKNAGREFLRRAKRQMALKDAMSFIGTQCKELRCFSSLAKLWVGVRNNNNNEAQGRAFTTELHSCKSKCNAYLKDQTK